jgi:hypothetical protein
MSDLLNTLVEARAINDYNGQFLGIEVVAHYHQGSY